MRITVNDTALYFDVEGAGLVPDGAAMRARPTIVALHGGPGFDHAYFKPALSTLTDTAQIVFLDLRGQGRSDRPPVETCTLEQMADDVAAFCRTLGIHRPVVLGHSAGGFVALHLAVRHPDLAGRLILVDTAAATAGMGDAMGRLEARYGAAARAAGERLFGGDFSAEAFADFGRLVFPAYFHNPATAGEMIAAMGRTGFVPEVAKLLLPGTRAAVRSAGSAGQDRGADAGGRRGERLALPAGGGARDCRGHPGRRAGGDPGGGAFRVWGAGGALRGSTRPFLMAG